MRVKFEKLVNQSWIPYSCKFLESLQVNTCWSSISLKPQIIQSVAKSGSLERVAMATSSKYLLYMTEICHHSIYICHIRESRQDYFECIFNQPLRALFGCFCLNYQATMLNQTRVSPAAPVSYSSFCTRVAVFWGGAPIPKSSNIVKLANIFDSGQYAICLIVHLV